MPSSDLRFEDDLIAREEQTRRYEVSVVERERVVRERERALRSIEQRQEVQVSGIGISQVAAS